MEIKFMPKAEEDLVYWKATGNKRVMKRITKLLELRSLLLNQKSSNSLVIREAYSTKENDFLPLK